MYAFHIKRCHAPWLYQLSPEKSKESIMLYCKLFSILSHSSMNQKLFEKPSLNKVAAMKNTYYHQIDTFFCQQR